MPPSVIRYVDSHWLKNWQILAKLWSKIVPHPRAANISYPGQSSCAPPHPHQFLHTDVSRNAEKFPQKVSISNFSRISRFCIGFFQAPSLLNYLGFWLILTFFRILGDRCTSQKSCCNSGSTAGCLRHGGLVSHVSYWTSGIYSLSSATCQQGRLSTLNCGLQFLYRRRNMFW